MLNLPLTGVIDRRLLLNFRADAAVVNALLPAPFRAQLVDGYAIVGVCLIRLKHERIKGLPAPLGLGSENGAHRFAVEWEANGQRRTGVFIPRRDTSSRLNYVLGNRLMGIHHHSMFQVVESAGKYAIAFRNRDKTHLEVEAHETTAWPDTSLFASLQEASDFFRLGAVGYSPRATGGGFAGVALRTNAWQVAPVAVERISSSYFADETLFPTGSVAFDNALLMRDIRHEWQQLPSL